MYQTHTNGKANALNTTIAALLAVLLCSSMAMAQGQGNGSQDKERGQRKAQKDKEGADGKRAERKGRRGHLARALLKDIELSDDQKTEIREVMKEAAQARMAWHEKHKDEIKSLRDQMQQARKDKDREKAKQVMAEMRKLMQSAPKPTDTFDKVKAKLNADQSEQFEKNVAELKDRMEKRREAHKKRHEGERKNRKERKDKDDADDTGGDA